MNGQEKSNGNVHHSFNNMNIAQSSPRTKQQQRSKLEKTYLTLHNFIYICGMYLLISKTKSRFTPPKSFALDDYPLPPPPSSTDNAASTDTEQYRIPKIIHQSYKSQSTLPLEWADTPARWQELHPTYEYKFWSDDDNRKLIQQYYPWFLETYDAYPAPIQRADAARYFAVLHYGGIYADMDILPIRNVDPILYKLNNSNDNSDNKEMIVAETYNLGLTNALFAAIPNSTVLHDFVRELPLHTKPLHGLEVFIPHFAVLLSTGPTRLWIYLNQHRSKILTLNPAGWGQCHQCKQKQCVPQEGSFFETRKGGSWHKWDTRIMNFIFCHVHFCIWGCVCALIWLYYKCIKKDGGHGELAHSNKYEEEQKLMAMQDDDDDDDVTRKKRKWNNASIHTTFGSFENVAFMTRILISQHRFALTCGIILILLL